MHFLKNFLMFHTYNNISSELFVFQRSSLADEGYEDRQKPKQGFLENMDSHLPH